METAAKTAGVHLYPMLSQMIGCLRSISSRDGFQIELIAVTLLPPRIHHDRKKVFFMSWALVLSFAHPVRHEGWLSELLLSEDLVCCQAICPKKNALNNLIISVFLFPLKVIGLILKQTFPNFIVQNFEYFI